MCHKEDFKIYISYFNQTTISTNQPTYYIQTSVTTMFYSYLDTLNEAHPWKGVAAQAWGEEALH